MIPISDQEIELMADKVAHMLRRNWYIVDFMVKSELHTSLSKREAVAVARRALELMEEKQI